jgi:hypothetical protein
MELEHDGDPRNHPCMTGALLPPGLPHRPQRARRDGSTTFTSTGALVSGGRMQS